MPLYAVYESSRDVQGLHSLINVIKASNIVRSKTIFERFFLKRFDSATQWKFFFFESKRKRSNWPQPSFWSTITFVFFQKCLSLMCHVCSRVVWMKRSDTTIRLRTKDGWNCVIGVMDKKLRGHNIITKHPFAPCGCLVPSIGWDGFTPVWL